MAESTLAISHATLLAEIGGFLGFGRSNGAWSGDQSAVVDSCIASGLRQFYFPSPLPGESKSHVWSFMTPTTEIVAWPDYEAVSTRLVTGVHAAGSTTVTLTTGTGMFAASMIGKSITITGIGTFTITGYTSATVITVSGDATCAGVTFSLTADGNYPLPDDFGGMRGNMTFEPDVTLDTVRICGELDIRRRRQSAVTTGQPQLAATRPISTAPSGSTVGQRFELLLWPIPDDAYVLEYRYAVLPNVITGSNVYAYGGAMHAETILQSCLAVAEQRNDDTIGNHTARFMERLAASIAMDRQLRSPDHIGYIGDPSGGRRASGPGDNRYVTYNDVLYEG